MKYPKFQNILCMNLFVRGYTLCVTGTVIAAMISILLSAEGYMRS